MTSQLSASTYRNLMIEKVATSEQNLIAGKDTTAVMEVSFNKLPALFVCVDKNLMSRIQYCYDNRQPISFTASGATNLIQGIESSGQP